MKNQHYLVALLFATLLLAACSKEKTTGETTAENSCVPSEAYLYGEDNNLPYTDTLSYTYIDKHIVKVTGPQYYVTFDYTNGRISRRNYFHDLTSSVADKYEIVTYNSDGTVAKTELYSTDGTTAEMEERNEFTYTSGKLTKLTYAWYTDGAASGFGNTHFYTYTGNNITRDSIVKTDPDETTISLYRYTYDAQENHLSKRGINALFYSAFYLDGIDGSTLPFFVSANNVTGALEAPATDAMQFGYTTDGNGNLDVMTVNGTAAITWKYDCQ